MSRRPRQMYGPAITKGCETAALWLHKIGSVGNLVAERANAYVDEAVSGRCYEGVNRGGNDATHPERLSAKPQDDPTKAFLEFQELEANIRRDTARLAHLAEYFTKLHERAKTEAGESQSIGAGDCIVCGRYVPGIKDDRRRAGRCHTCFSYWTDHHREVDRPRELWAEESVA